MKSCILCFLCFLGLHLSGNGQVTLVPYKDAWKYLDNGSDPGTAWRSTTYNDDAWSSGKGKFGYGGDGIATTVSYGPSASSKYVTTYFRKSISLPDPSVYGDFTGSVSFDDGVAVYVNGTEVFRNNLPSGTLTYTTLASSSTNTTKSFTIPKGSFVAGTNVLAVEVHQASLGNADLAFDLKLAGNPDETAPTAARIDRLLPATATTKAATVTFRAVFSEKVSGVDAADFTPKATSGTPGGAVTALAPAGTEGTAYDVTVSGITGSGALKLNLKSSGTGIADAVGNQLVEGFSSGQAYTIDRTAPTLLSSNRQVPTAALTGGTGLTFRLSFSEAVTGVDAADFVPLRLDGTVTGKVTSVTPSGSSGALFDVQVATTGSGSLRLDLKSTGTGIADIATNALAGGFTAGQTYQVDGTPPFVSSISRLSPLAETTKASTVNFRVVFSEKVSSVGPSDFSATALSGTVKGTIVSGDVDPVGTDGTTYDVKVTSISGTGQLRLDLKAEGTGIVDALKNPCGGYTAGQAYRIDKTAPKVLSVARYAPVDTVTNATWVVFRVAFTEGVSGVDSADFSLATLSGTVKGVLATGAVTPVGTDGTTYNVRVSGLSGDGQLRLNVKSSGTGITDIVGYALSGGFTSGEHYTLDMTAPRVVSINRLLPVLNPTDTTQLNWRVTFTEAVTGLAAGGFTLRKTGTAAVTLHSVTGSGSVYQVRATITAGSGSVYLDLTKPSGIRDVGGNAPAAFTGGQPYDRRPFLTAVSIVSANPYPALARPGDGVTINFTASEPVIPDIVAIGKHTAKAVALSATTYTVTDKMTDADVEGKVSFRITYASKTGTGGKAVTATTNGSRVFFDKTPPAVTRLWRYAPTTASAPEGKVVFRTQFSEPVFGVNDSDFTVRATTAGGTVAAVSGGGNTYDVTVNGFSGSGTLGLVVNSRNTLITDSAGNELNTDFIGGEAYQVPPAYERPGVQYWESFEYRGGFDGMERQTSTPYGFTITDSLAFAGRKVGRWELRNSDPMASDGARAEVLFPEDFRVAESWHSFAGYFPASEYAEEDDDETINQWHQGGEFGSPMLTLRTEQGFFRVRRRGSDGIATTNYDLMPIPHDQWVSFVIHIKQHLTSGIFQVWINGELKLDYKGPTMYRGPYGRWKIGIYKSDWNKGRTTGTDLRVWYIDEVKFGLPGATYAGMQPSRTGIASPAATAAPRPAAQEQQATAAEPSPEVYPTLVQKGTPLTIKTNRQGTTRALLTDASGRPLSTLQFTGTATIETGHLAPGLYFLTLYNGKRSHRQKFLITD
ncbi:heparin lyase I family protein [Paraflavisolibacter sp. H34]|uniref:heparin lyase I family protein n=1 Tax=Huijunlia imazamoxiresistens TaxID=3127457 RepID=UPI0030196B41